MMRRFLCCRLSRLIHDIAPVVTNETRLQNIRILMDNASKLMEDTRKIFADLNKTGRSFMSVFKKIIIQIRNLTALLVVKANWLNIKGKWRVQHQGTRS